MNTTSPNPSDTPFGAPPRPLTEDVLQTAEEAVLSSPAAVETLQSIESSPAPDRAAGYPSPNTDRLALIVAERPLQSALVAMLAGALMASLVKLALRRRHG